MKIDKEKTFDFNSSIFLRTFIRDFLKTESSSGVLLIIFSILAIILSNTELSNFYYSLKNSYLTINFGDFELKVISFLIINSILLILSSSSLILLDELFTLLVIFYFCESNLQIF